MSERIRRSMLYTPADDREMMRSALGSEADAVIFDLEDAVPHSGLEDARGNVPPVSIQCDRERGLIVDPGRVVADVRRD